MDPDAALRTCLDPDATEEERHEAGLALQGWLRRCGFPPAEQIVLDAGVTSRRPLYPSSRCRLFLEKKGRYWVIVWTGSSDDPVARSWRLRRTVPARRRTRPPAPPRAS